MTQPVVLSWQPDIRKQARPREEPLYLALVGAMERDIAAGILQPGDKLPPQRELADWLGLNLSTVTRAFKLCEMKGLIDGVVGRGTFVAAGARGVGPMLGPVDWGASGQEPGLAPGVDLGASHPLYLGNEQVAEVIRKVGKKSNLPDLMRYTGPRGLPRHRRSATAWLGKLGLERQPDEVLVASGLQNSLALCLASLFRAGDKLAVDSLTYPGFKSLAALLGLRLVPIAGFPLLQAEALERQCRLEQIKGVYLGPDCHNPTAGRFTLEQRRELARVIKKHGLLCLEDATYSWLDPAPLQPLAALAPELTVYISTLSNALCPGLRISFMAAPGRCLGALTEGVANINVMSSPLDLEVAAHLIAGGLAGKLVEEKRLELEARNRLAESLLPGRLQPAELPGQFRWLGLGPEWAGRDFESVALQAGVKVFGGNRFVAGNAAVRPGARLALSTPPDQAELARGLEILAGMLTTS